MLYDGNQNRWYGRENTTPQDMLKKDLVFYSDAYSFLLNTTTWLVYNTNQESSDQRGTHVILNNLNEIGKLYPERYNFYAGELATDTTNNVSNMDDANETIDGIFNILGEEAPHGIFASAMITMVFLIIFIGTIVGNILVCVAVCLVKKLRRPYNYLLVSLAVSDLCVAILVMPMAAIYELLGSWPFGVAICDVWVCSDLLCCTASILNLCVIAVDRYNAITNPLEYAVKRTPKRMVLCVVIVWTLAVCVSLPPFIILGNENEGAQCIVSQHFGYQIYATICSFYLPLTVMVIVYYKIFRAAKKIVLEEKRSQSHKDTSYSEVRATKRDSTETQPLTPEDNISLETASAFYSVREFGRKKFSKKKEDELSSSVVQCFSLGQRSSNDSQMPFLRHHSVPGRHHKFRRSSSRISNHSHNSQLSNHDIQTHHNADNTNNVENNVEVDPNNKIDTRKDINTEKDNHSRHSTRQRIRMSIGNIKSRSLTGINAKEFLHSFNSSHHRKLKFHLAKEKKASRTLGIIMSAFIVCWLPFFVLALVRPFLEKDSIPDILSSIFLWLGYVNSLLNPIIYATLNKDFRKPFHEMLNFRCSKLKHMMREDLYHSQFGERDHHYPGANNFGAGVAEFHVERIVCRRKTSESFL